MAGIASEEDAVRAAAMAALADVESMNLKHPVDRAVVLAALLTKRLDLLGGASASVHPREHQQRPPLHPGTDPTDDGDLLGRVCAAMTLPREIVELVYDAHEGDLSVLVSARRLPDDRASATRQLAQLVAGGRQAAGLEEWTSMGVIRAVVTDYGRLDSGNFATTVARLDDVFLFRGKGANRFVKVTRPGMEHVAALVSSLAGPV
jgi:hypothetical protein